MDSDHQKMEIVKAFKKARGVHSATKKSSRRSDLAGIPMMINGAQASGRITRRVLTIVGDLSTNAAGFVPSASAFSSANAFSAPDFTALSTLFVSYRVVAMEVDIVPVTNVNTTTSVEVPAIACCSWNGGTSPSTYQQITEAADYETHMVRGTLVRICAKARQTQDKLWTGITSSITGTSTFGVAYGAPQTGRGSTPTTQWCRYVQRMLVELQYAG
jgi:hypothetical protein